MVSCCDYTLECQNNALTGLKFGMMVVVCLIVVTHLEAGAHRSRLTAWLSIWRAQCRVLVEHDLLSTEIPSALRLIAMGWIFSSEAVTAGGACCRASVILNCEVTVDSYGC